MAALCPRASIWTQISNICWSNNYSDTYLLLFPELLHLLPQWQKLASTQPFSEPPPKHSLSVLAWLLLFSVFHPFADLSSCLGIAAFAILTNRSIFTLPVSSTVRCLWALDRSWTLPPCAQENYHTSLFREGLKKGEGKVCCSYDVSNKQGTK